MPFDINWGLAQPANALGMAVQGFQAGREMGREARQRHALATYAQNPDSPDALSVLAQTGDARLIMQEGQRRRELAQEVQLRDIRSKAAAGDQDALLELVGRDPQTWTKIDEQSRERIKQATSFMGQAVQDVARLPEEAKAAAWANYVQRAEASGMDIPEQYERYSPEALNAAAAEAGTMERLIKQFEPDLRFSPNGGLVDFNDPASIDQYQKWMGSGQAPSATMPPPPSGFVIDGGPTPQASARFP